jgi:hypothetical protein
MTPVSIRRIRCLVFLLVSLPVGATSGSGLQQMRDHLTEEEADRVREAQILDLRMDVFIFTADRRLLVLNNPNAVQKKKEEELWGPLPKGTRLELITDIKKIYSEAMEKIDDASARSKSDPVLAKALDKLKKAAVRQIAEMKALQPKLTEKREVNALLEAIEEAEVASKGSLQ